LYPRLYGLVRIVLLNSGDTVLSAFDSALQNKALITLRSEGIDIRLGAKVLEVKEGLLVYQLSSKSTNTTVMVTESRQELKFGVCVWAAGTTGRPLTVRLAEKLGSAQTDVKKNGRLHVDPWFRLYTSTGGTVDKPEESGTSSSIFALGDASSFRWQTEDERRSDLQEGPPLPQTAQVAAQEGAFLARLFNRRYNLSLTPPAIAGTRVARPFAFLDLGLLAYIGDSRAVAQVQLGDVPLAKLAGDGAFLLWRSVYLVKQVSARSRFLVLFDFIKTKIFGRDLSGI
jgi:NADH dehydrogenase FAD-containing subunit